MPSERRCCDGTVHRWRCAVAVSPSRRSALALDVEPRGGCRRPYTAPCRLPGKPRTERVWRLNVVPRKIDSARYLALIEDVERVAIGLVRSLAGAVVGAHLRRMKARPAHGSMMPIFCLDHCSTDSSRQHTIFLAHPRSTLQRDERQTPLGQATDVQLRRCIAPFQGDLEVASPTWRPMCSGHYAPKADFCRAPQYSSAAASRSISLSTAC
jgi:hypothetical protein